MARKVIKIQIPADLHAQLLELQPPLDVDAICERALLAALDGRNGVLPTVEPKRGRGRPPTGRTREVRGLNLRNELWVWLEAQVTGDETLQDAANRILLWAMENYPHRR